MQSKKYNSRKFFAFGGLLLLTVAVVLFVLFLLSGEVKFVRQEQEEVLSKSLACRASDVKYSFFKYSDYLENSTKVNILFEDNKLKSISFLYISDYIDNVSLKNSKDINESSMKESIYEDGINDQDLSITYSYYDNKMSLSLYAIGDGFNAKVSKYFLLEGLNHESKINSFIEKYEKQGFSCEEVE